MKLTKKKEQKYQIKLVVKTERTTSFGTTGQLATVSC